MAERHDTDDHMQPVDAHHLQRLRAPTQTGQGASAGTDRDQDPHFSSLVAQAQFIVRRAEVAGLLEARRGRALGSEGELVVGGNDPQLTSPPWVSAKAVLAELRFALPDSDDAEAVQAIELEIVETCCKAGQPVFGEPRFLVDSDHGQYLSLAAAVAASGIIRQALADMAAR